MKKILLTLILLLSTLFFCGCTKDLKNISNNLEELDYVYPDSKEVVVSLEEYNKLKTGMSEKEVWDIIGGQCTNTGTTDLGIGEQYKTASYGCNGNGGIGSNVVLMFQGGKLSTMSQLDLK